MKHDLLRAVLQVGTIVVNIVTFYYLLGIIRSWKDRANRYEVRIKELNNTVEILHMWYANVWGENIALREGDIERADKIKKERQEFLRTK
jgi:hypothetical protein